MTISVVMPELTGEISTRSPLDEEQQQLMAAKRGRISLSQGQAAERLSDPKQSTHIHMTYTKWTAGFISLYTCVCK